MIIVNHRTTDCTHRLYVKFCSTRSGRYKITHTSPPEIKDQLTKKDLLTRKSKKNTMSLDPPEINDQLIF